MKKGDVFCYTSGIYSAIKWRDKKDVAVLSTIHRGRICDIGKIDRKTKEVAKKPEAVIEYNANMGGVDRLDQKIKPYECLRKSVRWYRITGEEYVTQEKLTKTKEVVKKPEAVIEYNANMWGVD